MRRKDVICYYFLHYLKLTNELVAILSNGQIMFCHERYCRFHSATDIITNFNVDAYDFRSCICDEEIKKKIRQNGGIIDV